MRVNGGGGEGRGGEGEAPSITLGFLEERRKDAMYEQPSTIAASITWPQFYAQRVGFFLVTANKPHPSRHTH